MKIFLATCDIIQTPKLRVFLKNCLYQNVPVNLECLLHLELSRNIWKILLHDEVDYFPEECRNNAL